VIRVSAFRWVPPFAQGQVRDLRVRWALEEAGLPYEAMLIGPAEQATPEYRRLQPWGQVPVYEEDGLVLFESGAIVLHIAQRSDALLPADPAGRARASAWLIAALNSVEPGVQELAGLDFFHANEEWARLRRPLAREVVRRRLGPLADWLGAKPYLEDRFTAGDLMMSTVLRILGATDVLDEYPSLAAYRARCEARPAFQKALEAQLAPFAVNPPDR